MGTLDWIILSGTLLFIVVYGVWKTRGSKNVQDYVRGGNDAKWWTIGLSVMATQASAITFLSTPGQAFHDGMGFVQFYFGLPLAMIVICLVFIPIYHRLNVYTAYEFLENRFDLKTRSLTAVLFLIQRGLAAGITIYAPSIILSAVLGWDLWTLNIIIGNNWEQAKPPACQPAGRSGCPLTNSTSPLAPDPGKPRSFLALRPEVPW